MAKKNQTYFESRPDIVKLFDDIDAFHDFCRFEMLPFNPADLYNRASWVWRKYENRNKPRAPKKHYQKKYAK